MKTAGKQADEQLQKAAGRGDVEAVKAALAAGADVNAVAYDGTGSLDFAKTDENAEMVNLLQAAGARG